MKGLTKRQEEILQFIAAHQERMGRAPTGPEIAARFGFRDPSTAYQHVRALAQKGYLEIIQPGQRRVMGIRLLEQARRYLEHSWPVLGTIPAGPLSEVLGMADARVGRVEDLLPGIRSGDYFLQVDGDSMAGAGLLPGTYVVVRPELPERDGEICAVWVDGEGGTLKYFHSDGETVRLVPANPRYQSRLYPAERVRVQGVVVATFALTSFRH